MQGMKATRMELLRLKKQLKIARKGYSLLEDKLEGLVRKFLEFIRELKDLRKNLDEKLAEAFKFFVLNTATLSEKEIEEILTPPFLDLEFDLEKENIMGVQVPKFSYKINQKKADFSFFLTPLVFKEIWEKFFEVFEIMVKIAQVEHSARLLSFEIEKTRRRLNSLEYKVIPKIQEVIKFITFKLDEQERSSKILKIKIKRE